MTVKNTDSRAPGAHPCVKLFIDSSTTSRTVSAHDRTVPNLHLVSDDYGRALVFQGLRIVAAPEDRPPFPVDAVAFEEDTNLLMSSRAELRVPEESFSTLLTDIAAFEPLEPGTVISQGEAPLRLLAVVHDIEQTPTWRESWVKQAVAALLVEADEQAIEALCLPVLGSIHGAMTTARFAALFRQALEARAPKKLLRVWVIVADDESDALLDAFR
jgi:hypothetical protein